MKQVEFFWDIGSTNTYFALHLIKPIVARHGAELVMHPFNLGYVFRLHDYSLKDEPAAKMRNRLEDLKRWAVKYNLPFRFPDKFPIKTSRVLRGAIVMRGLGLEAEYLRIIFRRYWEQNDASIADIGGLEAVAEELGVDAPAFLAACDSERTRKALIDSTKQGLERGVFGAPSFIVDGELYWGKDRMDFIEDSLSRS
jgi:2-hydroxychromene-2-carboxylate isomerase